MKRLLVGTVLSLCLFSEGRAGQPGMMPEAAAATYEHLANAIIEIRDTEVNLVGGILRHHHMAALDHLAMAKEASGSSRASHLEAAATEISFVANEGDKRVQAVRQRLLKAGHHHHTDAETKEDYIFVDSAEKKGLLDLANRIGRMGASASESAIDEAMGELASAFDKAIKSD